MTMRATVVEAEPATDRDRSSRDGARHHRHAARLPRARRLRGDARQRRVAARRRRRAVPARCSPKRAARHAGRSTRAKGIARTCPTRTPPRSSAATPTLRIGAQGPMGRILMRGEAGPRDHRGARAASRRTRDRQAGQGRVLRHRPSRDPAQSRHRHARRVRRDHRDSGRIFCTTTTGTARSPMFQQNLASPALISGTLEPLSPTMTAMAFSTFTLPAIWISIFSIRS